MIQKSPYGGNRGKSNKKQARSIEEIQEQQALTFRLENCFSVDDSTMGSLIDMNMLI